MAEPEERHYNIDRLNMIFAIASCVLLLALIWLVADDYSREWKNYQRKFRELEIEKTRVKYDYAANELQGKDEYKALEGQLEEARLRRGSPRGRPTRRSRPVVLRKRTVKQKDRGGERSVEPEIQIHQG